MCTFLKPRPQFCGGFEHPVLNVHLVLLVAGEGEVEALELAAEVPAHPAATYLDRIVALCVLALANAQLGRAEAAKAAADAAIEAADATEDIVARTLARIASAEVLEQLGDPGAAAMRAEADLRAGRFDGALVGWRTAFALAARGASAAAVPT